MADQVDLEVPPSLDGERVDKAVAVMFEVSRTIASVVVARGVTLDGVPARASDRVRTGQTMQCRPPVATEALVPEAVDFDVIHEDSDVLVVDKPAGLVVHPGSGRTHGTLAAGLMYRYPELEGVGAAGRWGLVHRLDKETSGAILVARTQPAFDTLTTELRQREIDRTYMTLVEGRLGAPTGTIEAPIGRDPSRPTRRAVTHGGKHARTHYEVVRYFETDDASQLEVRLDTGRTHQIRVHLSAIDHPVVGDLTYGATRKDLNSPRTFLHASRLAFTHPGTKQRLLVEVPLPTDLTSVLKTLS